MEGDSDAELTGIQPSPFDPLEDATRRENERGQLP